MREQYLFTPYLQSIVDMEVWYAQIRTAKCAWQWNGWCLEFSLIGRK